MISRNKFEDFSDIIYEILMEIQNEDLILKYFDDIKLDYLKKELLRFVENDQKKLNYIKNSSLGWNNNKFIVACSLKGDSEKVTCLEYVKDVRDKVVLMKTITDEYLRAKVLMTLVPHFRYMVCETITNQDILRDLYFKNITCGFSHKLLCLIHDDKLKKQSLETYSIVSQVDIINSFDSEDIVKEIIWDSKYDEYCEGFIGHLKDEEFVLKYFNKSNSLNFKIKVINSVTSNLLKKRLIMLLDNLEYQNILLGNISHDKEIVLKDMDSPITKYDIDPNITIGVELEACCDYPEVYLGIRSLLCNWDIKLDRSVIEGVEITSPILHYTNQDLKELKFVCDFLNKNKFYTNDSCGGHIHLGFNYFDNINEFRTFLVLYQSVEDILYLISNRAYSVVRPKVNEYAKRLSPVLKNIAKINFKWEKMNDLKEYVTIVKKTCDSRYYGLNLSNVFEDKNTIEFRMPNGEIEFNEVILNIRLFAKLMEIAKKLTKIMGQDNISCEEKEFLMIYKSILSYDRNNYEKLQDLLTLLFPEEEHTLYINRYISNRKISKNKTRSINVQ